MKKQAAEERFVAEYRRIETDMRVRVRTGHWPAGTMLPSRRDLAREYKVSSVTVNRAIQPLLTDGTLRADDRRGTFVAASGLTRRPLPQPVSTGVFGIVATDEAGAFSQDSLILHSLEQALSSLGHVTAVCNRARGEHHSLLPLADAVQSLLDRRVDGIALICLDLDRPQLEAELSRLHLGTTPAVCILAGELHGPFPHIFYDNRIGGYQAARHLLDKGYHEITVIAPFTALWVTERINGIQDAWTRAGHSPDALRIVAGEGKPWDYLGEPVRQGYEAVQAEIAAGWVPHGGIICVNDFVALGLNSAALEHGWEPGRDYAVLGFDDHPAGRAAHLTTLRPPLEVMGREAARLLLEEVQGSSHSHQLRLRAHLIPRASTLSRVEGGSSHPE